MSDAQQKQRLRSREEIQRAHDILWSQVTGETPPVFDPQHHLFVRAALDVLCWVLRHDHSDGFTRSLATIEHTLAEVGIAFDDATDSNARPPTYSNEECSRED